MTSSPTPRRFRIGRTEIILIAAIVVGLFAVGVVRLLGGSGNTLPPPEASLTAAPGTVQDTRRATWTPVDRTKTPARLTQTVLAAQSNTPTPSETTLAVAPTGDGDATPGATSNATTSGSPSATLGRPSRTPGKTATATWFIRYFPTRTPLVVRSRTPTSGGLAQTRTPTRTVTRTLTITPTRTVTRTGTVTATRTITTTPTETPTFTPTPEARIAFSADENGDGALDVLTMLPDGSDARVLVQESGDALVCDWSPDRGSLVFELPVGTSSRLFTVAVAGGSPQLVGNQPAGSNTQASWSPNGEWLAFRNEAEGQADLYVLRITGGSQVYRLTNSAQEDAEPDWSPSSNELVFISEGNLFHLDVSWLPGAPPDPLLAVQWNTSSVTAALPRFSPAGDRLLFASWDGTQWDVAVSSYPTWAPLGLTSDPGNDSAPSWSPNGNKIAFLSDRGGSAEVFTMQADGSGQAEVPNGLSHERRPNWTP